MRPTVRSLLLFGALVPLGLLSSCQNPFAAAEIDAGPAQEGAHDLTAPKRAPALRVAKIATPPLPDLPSLASHAPAVQAPPMITSDNDDHPCKSVWTGSELASLACAKSLLYGANEQPGKGAQLVVPRSLLARSPDRLPAIVDHRLEGTEGPVRDQGSAPACTAFATSTALDHALARWGGGSAPVSVMQIWSRYHSPYVQTSLISNIGEPLGPEQGWPFSVNEATAWIACSEFSKTPRAGCGQPVDKNKVARITASAIGEFTEVEYLGATPDVNSLLAKIASGQDVIVTLELPPTFVPRGRKGAQYIPHYTKSAGSGSGHALVLAGYVNLKNGVYFLAHNSWGTKWGDGGYAWIHQATLALWTREMVAIDAEPLDRDPKSRARRLRGVTTCAGNLVVDSIRGTCSPPCPDRSPRHDGVCAVPGECPAGYTNLTGACVLAAPTVNGQDPDTGVQWTCGAGGCSYIVPRSSDPSCTGSTCKASCPAPDFHLAKMGNTMVCVE